MLWSSSWVIIKFGLQDLPPLTFAGLRYVLAAIILAALSGRGISHDLHKLTRRDWASLIILGIFFITITQGAQYYALTYLPAVTVSLLLNTTSLLVAGLGMVWLHEKPLAGQWAGVLLFTFGAWLYFNPAPFPAGEWRGLAAGAICTLANAISSLMGRQVNRQKRLSPRLVTLISMSAGSLLLLSAGLALQGLPAVRPIHWLYILWLAVINTAFAFTLWNHSLRQLKALESSIINGTMLVQIALLAVIFLGERLSLKQAGGLALVTAGSLLVQLRQR